MSSQKIDSSSKVPSKEPALKFTMEEFREKKRLQDAGDIAGVEALKKKVRQRMESELASDLATTSKKSFAAASTSSKLSVKDMKNLSTSKNMVNNDDKKKVKLTSKSISESLTIVKKEKNGTNKEKSKSFVSESKTIHENSNGKRTTSIQNINKEKSKYSTIGSSMGKQAIKSTSTSKGPSVFSLSIKSGNRSVVSKEKLETKKVSSSKKEIIVIKPELKKCIERWKLMREKGDTYITLERFLLPEILDDKDQMVTVEKIAKEFELERLKRLLEQDKKRPNGNKQLARERIENLNNFGESLTRLEIAAFRNEKGPKKDQQIRVHINFLNEKNILKLRKVTSSDVIENPYYLKRCIEQFQEEQNKEKLLQRKGTEKQKDLERKRKPEGKWDLNNSQRSQEKFEQGKRKSQFLEKKSEKLGGKLSEQKRHQESVVETKRRQQERFPNTNRIEDLRRSKHGNNTPKKLVTNKNDTSKSTLLKKRTFDERSETATPRATKRRNIGSGELDICRMDEATINENLSTIIHSLMRPGRQPIYRMVDNDDDDVMEVSGFDLFREEARSSRLARKEDEDEERAEQERRIRKMNKKKA